MKKVFLLLLILVFTKTLSAQSISLGGNLIGIEYYSFRQLSAFNSYGLTLSLCGQYTFKDSSFDIEASVLSGPNGVAVSAFYGGPGADYSQPPNISTADYFIFNLLKKHRLIKLQLKGGLFYSYFSSSYIGNSFSDYGPAFGIFAGIKISKKCIWGIELTKLFGTQTYTIPSYFGDWPPFYQPPQFSKLDYDCISLKIMYKL